jgi:hypothetical protein
MAPGPTLTVCQSSVAHRPRPAADVDEYVIEAEVGMLQGARRRSVVSAARQPFGKLFHERQELRFECIPVAVREEADDGRQPLMHRGGGPSRTGHQPIKGFQCWVLPARGVQRRGPRHHDPSVFQRTAGELIQLPETAPRLPGSR